MLCFIAIRSVYNRVDLYREAAKSGGGRSCLVFYCVRFTLLLKGFRDLGNVVLVGGCVYMGAGDFIVSGQ